MYPKLEIWRKDVRQPTESVVIFGRFESKPE